MPFQANDAVLGSDNLESRGEIRVDCALVFFGKLGGKTGDFLALERAIAKQLQTFGRKSLSAMRACNQNPGAYRVRIKTVVIADLADERAAIAVEQIRAEPVRLLIQPDFAPIAPVADREIWLYQEPNRFGS